MIKGAVREISGGERPTEQTFEALDANHSGFAVFILGYFPPVDDAVPYLAAK
jgi:hypothetical protein